MISSDFNRILQQAIKKLIKQMNFRNSKKVFIFHKIYKELANKEIRCIEELKRIKFVGDKIIEEIKSAMSSIAKIEGIELFKSIENERTVNNVPKTNAEEQIQELLSDFNHLSSNLSELEIKYGILDKNESQISLSNITTCSSKVKNNNRKETVEEDVIELSSICCSKEITENSDISESTSRDELNIVKKDDLVKIAIEDDLNKSIGMEALNNFLERSSESERPKVILSSIESETSNVVYNNFTNQHKERVKVKRKKQEYIPTYNSIPYLILKMIYFYNQKSENVKGMHKFILADKLNRLYNTEIGNSHKELLKRGLIMHQDNKFYLSERGEEMSEKLFANVEEKTEENRKDQIHLIIDSREKLTNRNHVYFQQYFIDIARITNLETRRLVVGDFIWIRNEKILDYCVERKALGDFRSSCFDGRLTEQLKRIKSLDFRIFYLLELNKKRLALQEPLVLKSLTYLKLDQRVTVIETKNTKESAEFLVMLHKRICNEEMNATELCGYGTFLEEGDKNKNISVSEFFIRILESFRNSSTKKAILIANKYKTLGRFISTCQNIGRGEMTLELIKLLESNGQKRYSKALSNDIINRFT